MKLRNKKTGEIVIFAGTEWVGGRIFLRLDDGKGIFKYELKSFAKFNEEWEDYEEPKKIYYISETGDEVLSTDNLCDYDVEWLKSIGNYFETKEDAEKAVEKLKAWKRLKSKGFKFTAYDLYSGSSVKDKTEGEFAISAECDDFVDNKDLDILFGGEE